MDLRDQMDLLVQQEQQDREALWVFLVRGESVACLDFQDQQVLQGNRDLQDLRETKVPLAQLALREQMDLVETLVLMVLLVLTGPQARTGSLV